MTDENKASLDIIRGQATELGIKFHHRANEATIRKLIDDHLNKAENPTESEPVVAKSKITPDILKTPVVPISHEEFLQRQAAENKRLVSHLIRVRIQCMNPQKKDWPGEIISVGSAKLGTFKKYVPFHGVEYHVPKIIFDMMKERKCTVFDVTRNARGQTTKKGRQIPEFNIEVLPPLTKEELSDLARSQAARAGQG